MIGLFCLHVICMLEHLRVERVPNEYILKRYTKKAQTKGSFDRKDYKTVSFDGTSFLYQHNEVFQLAMQVVRAATNSDEQRARAKTGLQELFEQMQAMGSSSPADDNQAKNVPDFETFEPDLTQFSMDMPNNGTTDDSGTKPRVILPPPVSKTKGSGKQTKLNTNYKPAGPTKKNIKKEEENKTKEEELHHDNESKVSERKITCSICFEKKGHNSRSCPRREELQNKATGTATATVETGATGDGKKRKRLCQGCNQLVRGHNVLSCPVIRDALAIARTMDKTKKRKTTVVPTTVKIKVEQPDEDEEEDDYNDDEDDEQDEEIEQDEDEDDEEDEEEDEDEEDEKEATPPPPRRSARRK
jgi:hypothetical protein